jgi:hypothetical protein
VPQPWQDPCPAPHLGGAKDRQHQVDASLADRRGTEDVQAVADLGILDLAKVPVNMQHEIVELIG